METLYQTTILFLEKTFEELSSRVEKPMLVDMGDGYAYRYKNKNVKNAIIQKLVRVVTGLRSVIALNRLGLIQEQASIQRILDELNEDIKFLSFSIIFDDFNENHQKYLDNFYMEEFDLDKSAIESKQKRPSLNRKNIRAYISKNRNMGGSHDSAFNEVLRTIHKTYSGYVHGASPHIMELYYGRPAKFNLSGAYQSPLYKDAVDDLLNYFYRSVLSFSFAASALGEDRVFQKVYNFSKWFADKSGRGEDLIG